MTKIIPFIILVSILLPFFINAASDVPYDFPKNLSFDLWGVLKRAAKWLLNIVIFVGVVIMVYAGFTFVTSTGNQAKTKTALNMIIYSLIGIAIAFLAYWIINLLAGFLETGQTIKP